MKRGNVKNYTETEILNIVGETLHESIDDIKGKSRKRNLVECIFIYAYFCKNLMKKVTLTSIGKKINRDHTSIVHYMQKVYDYIETDKKFANKIELVNKNIAL